MEWDGPQHHHRAAVGDALMTSASGAGRWGTKREEGDVKQQDRKGHETVNRINTFTCRAGFYLSLNCAGLGF